MSDENAEYEKPQPQEARRSNRRIRRRSPSQEIYRFLDGHTSQRPSRRVDRGLKPRRRLSLDQDGEARLGSPDSRTVWLANRNKDVHDLNVKDRWEGSPAQKRLEAVPDGLWIPTWIARVAKHPTRARLLAWLLDRFDDINAETPKCRAYLTDESGDRWWRTSLARIAADTLLANKVDSSLRQLQKTRLIELVPQGRAGTLIRPRGIPLIRAYHEATGDEAALDELKLADEYVQWHESITRRRVWGKHTTGVRVPDALMVICQGNPGPAALLAHTLYWHSDGRSGIRRKGYLWCAKSSRTLEQEMGYSRGAIDTWRKWLCEQGVIDCQYWVWDRRRDMGQKTLHLRPVPSVIEQALIDLEWDIQTALSNKHH